MWRSSCNSCSKRHDLGLHGDIEGGRRLVGDEHRRVERDGHRDHDALAHPPGELVRVGLDALLGRRDGDPLHQAHGLSVGIRLVHAAVLAEHLGDLPAHREGRVQRAQRILEDHRDLRAARLASLLLGHRQQVLPAVLDDALGDLGGRHVEDAHDRLRRHRLAGPGLTENGEGLALVEVKLTPLMAVAPIARMELDVEVLHVEQAPVLRLVLGGRRRTLPLQSSIAVGSAASSGRRRRGSRHRA
jgi:hypothetical protein